MTHPPNSLSVIFDAERAEAYDNQFPAMNPIKEAMHLLLRVQLSSLPADARILVAGAGTGAEARMLAKHFPGWHFTLADPAEAMLDVAQRHAVAEGFASRCTFHAGYVSSLPPDQHDGATSLLVSHFLIEADARQAFYEDIAARLKPGGQLFSLDLCAEDDAPSFPGIMGLWLALLRHGGVPEDRITNYRQSYGRDFSTHGVAQLEKMIEAAGFTPPAPVFQAALMRGYTARRT